MNSSIGGLAAVGSSFRTRRRCPDRSAETLAMPSSASGREHHGNIIWRFEFDPFASGRTLLTTTKG